MKRNLILYVFLAGAFFPVGCAVQPDSLDTDKGRKKGLSLLESEVICQEILSNKMWQLSKEGPFLSWKEAND